MLERAATHSKEQKKGIERIPEEELVRIVSEAHLKEADRLGVELSPKQRERMQLENVRFGPQPEGSWASGTFSHERYHAEPGHKEIWVDNSLAPVLQIDVAIHEFAHALSASETHTGLGEYVASLERHGYGGLNEGMTEHYTRHIFDTHIAATRSREELASISQVNAEHPYAYLVTYIERLFRLAAYETLGQDEPDEAAYLRVRDSAYRHYLQDKGGIGVLELCDRYIAPGSAKLFAAVSGPKKDKQDEAEAQLKAYDKLADSLLPEENIGLSVTTYKSYLDVKNYPGYPDHINETYVAEVIYARHFKALAMQYGETMLTDPLSYDFTDDAVTALYRQVSIIEEDLQLIKESNSPVLEKQVVELRAFRANLRLLIHLDQLSGGMFLKRLKEAATNAATKSPEEARQTTTDGERIIRVFRESEPREHLTGEIISNTYFYEYLYARVRGRKAILMRAP